MTFEAYHFGPSGQLFGSYHPAKVIDDNPAILLCPALFHEYYKAHFAFKQLALILQEDSFPTLRFDFRGCGDSFGETGANPLQNWIEDIRYAVEELRQKSSCQEVTIVAPRFSGTLVMAGEIEYHRLVIWDPVFSGGEYAQDLAKMRESLISKHLHLPASDAARVKSDELIGGRYSSDLLTQIAAIELADKAPDLEKRGKLSTFQSDADWIGIGVQMLYPHEVMDNIAEALKY